MAQRIHHDACRLIRSFESSLKGSYYVIIDEILSNKLTNTKNAIN